MISSCAKILRYFIGIFFISCFVNRMPVFCLPRCCGAFSSSLISFGLALNSEVNTCLVKVSAASCKTSAVAEPRCSSLTFAVPITRKMLPICSSVIFLLRLVYHRLNGPMNWFVSYHISLINAIVFLEIFSCKKVTLSMTTNCRERARACFPGGALLYPLLLAICRVRGQ